MGSKGVVLLVVWIVAVAAAAVASASANRPTAHAQARFVASYDVILTGGRDKTHHRDQGNGVVSDSHDNYQGRGILSLKEEDNGRLVPASNSFAYQSATWDLSGTNDGQGSFSCSPPIATTDGVVDAKGWVLGGVMYVRFSLVGTHEHNDDYDCGAHYTGYATDSDYEGQSLDDLQSSLPGGYIVTSADHPSVGTLTKTTDKQSSTDSSHEEISWTFSIVKRSGSGKGGPPPSKPGSPICTIRGTNHADNLFGSNGDDVICGFGGNDRIDGRGGSDLIFAGAGSDSINARDKTVDRVDGGPGKDKGTFDKQPRDRVASVEKASFG